jgi:hypothetical protein
MQFGKFYSEIGNWKLQSTSYILVLLLLAGCPRSKDTTHAPAPPSAENAVSGQYHEELLGYAIDNLNRLEEFDSADVLEQIFKRLNPQSPAKPAAAEQSDTLLAAWPETEMLRQIVNRLNQWIRTQSPPIDWKLDPMAAGLPKPLADLPQVKDLDRMEFSRFDGYALQEAVWLRDVALWARGDALDDLERAKSLFDWTVRNIQLDADSPQRVPLFPWETLLFGRGTAVERAWVFILLARQSGIDAALLGIDERQEDRGQGAGEKRNGRGEKGDEIVRPWCVAVLIEGQAYLFEPTLGLPIPAPKGVALNESGSLTIRPATLAQITADESLLRRLDADAGHVYGIKASDLKHVVVMLEASPPYLAARMKLLESRLAGAQKMALTTSPAAQVDSWKGAAHGQEVRLWLWPFQTLERRSHLDAKGVEKRLAELLPFYAMPSAPLRRGRLLYLKGKFLGDDGAIHFLQLARPPQEQLSASSAHPLEKLVYLRGKQDASYWLGLIVYQRGNYPAAVEYFGPRTLEFMPDGPWTDGARYNLARTFEAIGDLHRAMLLYNSNASSPGYLGDLLRAKWLAEQAETK